MDVEESVGFPHLHIRDFEQQAIIIYYLMIKIFKNLLRAII